MQKHLRDVALASGEGEEILSATIYGTVVHYAMMVLEKLRLEGRPDAVDVAVKTFEHYWLPENITDLDPRATSITWLPRQTWGGLQIRGRNAIRDYFLVLEHDNAQTLALELPFDLPITLEQTGEHTVGGTVDALRLRTASRRVFLSVEDGKTGKKPTYLRYAGQWTVYSWASLQPAFWEPFGDDLAKITEPLARKGYALFNDGSGLPVIPRRGRWLSWKGTFGVHDVGWRTEVDFARMKVAMDQYVKANEAEAYTLNMSGDVCMFCPFSRNGMCGGIPIAEITEGEPYR